MIHRILPALIALMLFAAPAFADPHPQPDAAAAEAYLAGIRTLKARFTQVDNLGQQLSGDFFLRRPGRMRFQYDPPLKDFIVADGLLVHYYDAQMKQASNAPIGQTLANFFLRKDLKFSGEVSVAGIKRDEGFLQITLVETGATDNGALTLFFTERPALELKKWRVVDGQGTVTDILLSDVETGIDLSSELFHYYDPERKKPKYN